MALVSVLIPSFNASRYIRETIESVYAQTWRDIEIIVVDDGSTDDTVEQIGRIQRDNLRLVRTPNKGASAARNTAFAESSGRLIQFLDADDVLSPRKIEGQIMALRGSEDNIAAGKWVRFTDNVALVEPQASPLWRDLAALDWLALSRRDGLGMTLPGLFLLPRTVVIAAGSWNEHLSLNDDGEFFTRVLIRAKRVVFSEDAICYYRSVPGSLSAQKTTKAWQSAWNALNLMQAETLAAEDSDRMRSSIAKAWQHLAHACYPHHRDLAEAANLRAALVHPTKILPDGGWRFRLLTAVLGWRLARRLQVLSGRL